MKTAIISGATSGIGLAVARAMLAAGWQVFGIGSTPASCAAALAGLNENERDRVLFLSGDLMQQREVNRLAAELGALLDQRCDGRLDVLINNAGCVRSWYATTEEGYEQQFALNHLAGFLLSIRLMPWLTRAGGRILFTGSNSHKGPDVHWRDIMFKQHYRPLRAYKQSKLCNLLTAFEFNRRYAGQGVHAFGIDPGLVKTEIGHKQTGRLVSLVWALRKRSGQPPEMSARTYVWLSEHEPAPAGLYYFNCRERPYSRHVTAAGASRLFTLSAKLCGLSVSDSRSDSMTDRQQTD